MGAGKMEGLVGQGRGDVGKAGFVYGLWVMGPGWTGHWTIADNGGMVVLA